MIKYKYGEIGINGKRFRQYLHGKEMWFSSEEIFLADKINRRERAIKNRDNINAREKIRRGLKKDEINAKRRETRYKYRDQEREYNKKWAASKGEILKEQKRAYSEKYYHEIFKPKYEEMKKNDPIAAEEYRQYRIQTQKNFKGRKPVEYKLVQMFNAARNRALKKNIPFDILLEDLILPDTCPVLGIPIYFNTGKGENRSRNATLKHSPSIDRIDNSKGYIKGNVMIISYRANILKNDGSLEELEKIVAYMKANLPKES